MSAVDGGYGGSYDSKLKSYAAANYAMGAMGAMGGPYAWPQLDTAYPYASRPAPGPFPTSTTTTGGLSGTPSGFVSSGATGGGAKEAGGGAVGASDSPPSGASPPSGFGFTQTSPTAAASAFPNSSAAFPTPPALPSTPQTGVMSFPAHSTTPHLASGLSSGAAAKKRAQPVPAHLKDQSYFERRRRNNESARRSRESRRMKEDQTHYKLMLLEAQNTQLQQQVLSLRAELERTQLFYAAQAHHGANAQGPNGQQ